MREFPPPFERLQLLYRNFQPRFEFRRQSFRDWWAHYLRQTTLDDFEAYLNGDEGDVVKEQLKQRHFYRSSTCFYRAYDLFLGFLILQRKRFSSWAEVTGYYSRFYFIQAFLNICQASWFGSEDSIPPDGLANRNDRRFFVYNTGQRIRFLRERDLLDEMALRDRLGPHAIWWKVYECLGTLDDFPPLETLEFVLSNGYFNVERRNTVNYSHEYVEGFPELEWFDADVRNMMAHFEFQPRRADRDVTDIDRFFEGIPDEEADVGEFYGDEAQMLWCSIDCYLRVLRALGIQQEFITSEKLEALADAHLRRDMPNLCAGLVLGIRAALG
jgi:hypothetical protein